MSQYLVFNSNQEKLAIGIEDVDRIIEYIEPNKIPDTRDYFLGVIRYNGKVLPLMDLTLKLFEKEVEKNQNTKVIVITWKERELGFVVENILGIDNFDESEYEKSDGYLNEVKDYVEGFIKSEEDEMDITLIIDPEKLFNLEDTEELTVAIDNN